MSATLVFRHDFYGHGLADLTFLQVPGPGTLLPALHGVALHSPGIAGVARRDGVTPAETHGMEKPKL